METLIIATPHRVVSLEDTKQRDEAIAWWQSLTDAGGEGLVFKPESWIVPGKKGLVQPAVKCRGPEYDDPQNLSRLRKRSLATKRSLALREYALGLEALYRFVEREPLWRVHECVFGVLALESEPVDPRL